MTDFCSSYLHKRVVDISYPQSSLSASQELPHYDDQHRREQDEGREERQ